MPSMMIINTESTVGYNIKLKQAVAGMKLGVNNYVNAGTRKAGLQLMEGGGIKNKPAQQPSFKPDPQSCHGCAKPKACFGEK